MQSGHIISANLTHEVLGTEFLVAGRTVVIYYPIAWCLVSSVVDASQLHTGAGCHLQPWPSTSPKTACGIRNSLNFPRFHMHKKASDHISKQTRGRESHVPLPLHHNCLQNSHQKHSPWNAGRKLMVFDIMVTTHGILSTLNWCVLPSLAYLVILLILYRTRIKLLYVNFVAYIMIYYGPGNLVSSCFQFFFLKAFMLSH